MQIRILKEKDKRMRTTTEVVNNIKAIKLNSWIDYFVDKITSIRNSEIFLIKIGFLLGSFNLGIARLISPALVISILAIFYATGNSISIAKAFGGIQVLKMLEFPLRWIPEFVSAYLEYNVSMKRIQTFLLWSELNHNLISLKNNDLINKDIDILVENSNFTWGGQSEKLDNKDKNKNTKSKYYTIKNYDQ